MSVTVLVLVLVLNVGLVHVAGSEEFVYDRFPPVPELDKVGAIAVGSTVTGPLEFDEIVVAVEIEVPFAFVVALSAASVGRPRASASVPPVQGFVVFHMAVGSPTEPTIEGAEVTRALGTGFCELLAPHTMLKDPISVAGLPVPVDRK